MASSPEPFVTLGWSAISWIEHYLVHGPGDVQGQPIELDDEFGAFILKAYRLDPKTGARRVRRAFLSRSKGRSKSGLASFIECFEALAPARFDHWAVAGEVSDWGYEYEPGEPVGAPLKYVEILNVATEENQAGNTYDAVYYALNPETCSEALLEDYPGLDVGLTRINLPHSRGFIEPVSASNESKDGGKSTFIVADETHLWIPPVSPTAKFKLGKMHQTMVRNLLKRKLASGWMLETSTMYGQGEKSVAEGTHTYAKQLDKSGRSDGKLLFDHRQAADHWELEKRGERLKALREAYGPASEWMDLEAIADYWDDPQASHAEFRRFWLNQPVPMVEEDPGALPYQQWLGLEDADAARGAGPVFGLDVSEDRSGWFAVAWTRPDESVQVMLTNEGEPVPAYRVASEGARLSTSWSARVLSPRGFVGELHRAGATVEKFDSADFAAACGAFADGVKAGTIHHGNQPALNAAVKAARWRSAGADGVRAFQLKDMPEVGPLAAAVRAVRGLSPATGDVWDWPDDDDDLDEVDNTLDEPLGEEDA